jgi:hypothetical protein
MKRYCDGIFIAAKARPSDDFFILVVDIPAEAKFNRTVDGK